MTIQQAIILLCQMYLPCFDEKEKEALTMAIEALQEKEMREPGSTARLNLVSVRGEEPGSATLLQ